MKRYIYIGAIAFLVTLFIAMAYALFTLDIKFELYNKGKIVCFKNKNCYKLMPIK